MTSEEDEWNSQPIDQPSPTNGNLESDESTFHMELSWSENGKNISNIDWPQEETHFAQTMPATDLQYIISVYCHYTYGAPMHEVIEMSAVLVNLQDKSIESSFTQFVKPETFPNLTDYCTRSTHITQADADNGVSLDECLFNFSEWVKECSETLFPEAWEPTEDIVFCCWGENEILKNAQLCTHYHLKLNYQGKQWLDVKKAFHAQMSAKLLPRPETIASLGLRMPKEGNRHSALCAAKNMAKIVCYLKGCGDQVLELVSSHILQS